MKKVLLGIAALAIVSCSGNTDTPVADTPDTQVEDTQVAEEPQTEDATEEASDAAVAELTIEGDDQMKFNLDELKVKAGQRVKLTLKHVGKMGKDVMGHNWVLLTPGTDTQEFGLAAVEAKESDHIPTKFEDNIIVHTDLIGGGESTTIEFDAPEAGTYDFLCSFPGHFGTMKGKFIVE